jgi:hypothetical protein
MTPIDFFNGSLVGHALRKREWSVGNLRRLRMEPGQPTRRGRQLSSENQTRSRCTNNKNDGSQARTGGSAFAKATADRLGLGFLFHLSFVITSSFDIRISSFGFNPTVLAPVSAEALT